MRNLSLANGMVVRPDLGAGRIGKVRALVLEVDPDAAANVFVHALPHADGDELPHLCEGLVWAGAEHALVAVIRLMHRLDAAVLGKFLRSGGGWSDALAMLLHGSDARAAMNAVHAVASRGDFQLAPAVAEMLTRQSDEVSAAAAAALLEMASRAQVAARDGMPLHAALAAAAHAFPLHRRDEVALAVALRLHRAGPRLIEIVRTNEPLRMRIRAAARRTGSPAVTRRLLRWLTIEPLRSISIRWMHAAHDAAGLTDLLEDGHLLRAPARRRAIRRIDKPALLLPAGETALALPAGAQRHLAALITSLEVRTAQRAEALAATIRMADPLARLHGLHALVGVDSPETCAAAISMCGDPSPRIARLAAHHAARLAAAGGASFTASARHRDPIIARDAAARLARRNVEAFFGHWRELEPSARLAAALHLLRRQPDAFTQRLCELLVEAPHESSPAAVALVRRLHLADGCEPSLRLCAASGDVHLAASAIAALGEARSARAREALRAALRHRDGRVRANAVEALDRTGCHAELEMIAPLAESRQNRARGNAIRALIRHGCDEAGGRLRTMLADPDPRHRASAIWVAQRARLVEIVDDLRCMAHHDELPPIRARARGAARIIEHSVNAVDEGCIA